jgi:hypothetical protein
MKCAASLTLRSLSVTVTLLALVALALLLVPGSSPGAQTFAREVEAQLSEAEPISETDREPAISARLVLLLPDNSQRITSRVILHGLEPNAGHPTTGWFRIYDAREEVIFEGRWMATTFRQGAVLISLEGRGDGQFEARRLKLKLRATAGEESVLSGTGTGEIR